MIVEEVEQLSPEWFAMRAGVITGSGFANLITGNGKPSSQAEKYLMRLAVERVTGQPTEGIEPNIWMLRGIELEEEARDTLSFILGTRIDQVGFVWKDETRRVGVSPDGIIGANMGVEIKCPKAENHVGYLMAGALPNAYISQVQGALWVTGFEKWIFMSYYPGLKPFILEVLPDLEYHAKLDELVNKALKRIDEIVEQIK